MEYLIPFIESSQNEFIIGLMIVCIILLVLLFITMINFSLFKSKYKKLNKGSKGIALDEHIINNKKEIEFVKKMQTDILNKMDIMEVQKKKSYSKMTLHKYNAFENAGGKVSFILVMLDENRDGFILHNIHNNDFSYLYAKKVSRGTTEEVLTKEEKEVLLKTINNK